MATIESFRKLLKYLIVYSKVPGVEMWTAPGKFKPASYYVSFHIIVYFVSTVWTLKKYSDDPIHMMKVLITLGTAVQLYIKFFVGHSKSKEVIVFSNKIEQEVFEQNKNRTAGETVLLKQTGYILWFFFRFVTALATIVVLAFGLYPLFAYNVNGVVMPLFLYELPFYDWSTTIGYVVNMMFQVNLLVIGTIGAMLFDFLYFMYAMYTMVKADIFIIHLGELEKMLNDPLTMKKNQSSVREKWVQCMFEHQQTTNFLNSIEDIFGLMCLAQVSMGVFTICDAMLLVALTDWYPTYSFLLVMFIELSLYFLIGHLIEQKIDAMYNKIISMPWFKLPVKEQKEFRFLMSRQQCPMMLTAYGFHPMNFEAYMSVLKRLYQFFVMVMQYVG
nr:odorant receptor 30a-like isoform X1 [Anopheles coluzzii]XP_049464741.1 odorant receptor 30a-like isoform X2 [Anopheles coluzzii]